MTPLTQNALDRLNLYVKEIHRLEVGILDCLDDLSYRPDRTQADFGLSETERERALSMVMKASNALDIAIVLALDAVEMLKGSKGSESV